MKHIVASESPVPWSLEVTADDFRIASVWKETASQWPQDTEWPSIHGVVEPAHMVIFQKGSLGFASNEVVPYFLEVTAKGMMFLSHKHEGHWSRTIILVVKNTSVMRWRLGERMGPLSAGDVFFPNLDQDAPQRFALEAGDVLEFEGPFGFFARKDVQLNVSSQP